MQDSVTYRFLDINKMTTNSIPNYSPADYINQKEYSGSLNKPILDVCKEMYAEMNVTFYDRLFVFNTMEYVHEKHTPRYMYIPSGDIVYIYVMFMTKEKKEAFTNTVFNTMCAQLYHTTPGWTCEFERQQPTVEGWEYAVASAEGQRRARMPAYARSRLDWNGENLYSY
jgi:hypothetical protein